MSEYKIDFESMKWKTPADGVRFKAFEQNCRKLRLVEFFKEFIEPEWCIKGHIGYILEGQLEIDFNGNKEIFEPGDGVFIPSGEEHKHKAKVLTDIVKVILVEET